MDMAYIFFGVILIIGIIAFGLYKLSGSDVMGTIAEVCFGIIWAAVFCLIVICAIGLVVTIISAVL